MRVLTIYAHHNPCSFCHALLDASRKACMMKGTLARSSICTRIGFDLVLCDRDTPSWIDDSVPDDVLEQPALLQASAAFKSLCPASAVCMHRGLV